MNYFLIRILFVIKQTMIWINNSKNMKNKKYLILLRKLEIARLIRLVIWQKQKKILNVKIESYNEETGKIIATQLNDRTVGDPTGATRKVVIPHKDEVRAWLSN